MKQQARLGFIVLAGLFCNSITTQAHNNHSGFVIKDGKAHTEIPVKILNNLIIFPVKVNNSHHLNFILDTGIQSIVVFNKALDQDLEFKEGREVVFSGIGSKRSLKGHAAHDLNLQIGDVCGEGFTGVILDTKAIMFRSIQNIKIHGIMGYQLFSRFVVRIDYPNQKLTLFEPNDFCPETDEITIPISVYNTRPYVKSELLVNSVKHPIEGNLLIDTGANGTIIMSKSELPKALVYKRYNLPAKMGRGMSGTVWEYPLQLKQTTIGPLVLHDLNASFLRKSWFQEPGRVGSIGGGLLSQYIATFDYLNQKLYLSSKY